MKLEELQTEQLQSVYREWMKDVETFKKKGLALDMTRGKPCAAQLNHISGLTTILSETDFSSASGLDCRNYGLVSGLPEAKALFANILGTSPRNIIVGGASSLQLMYDSISRALLFPEIDSEVSWIAEPNRKWLCPVPGYDRHFDVTRTLGFTLIPIPMTPNGPDMDMVESLVREDPTIKGIWCTPLYSNPDGIVYSEETCRRLAAMDTAARDFRIFWDNAYVVHHLYTDCRGSIPDILALCTEAGNPHRVYEFASTSKITFAGAGISCIATSSENVALAEKRIGMQTIGPDKMNQLRHVRYLQGENDIEHVMNRHADIIRPKFEKTLEILERDLAPAGVARWNKPLGGYFISLFVMPGTAKRTVALAKELGVAFTPAGATYPYGMDPEDENIRIAPTFPSMEDVEQAIEILCLCAKVSAAEKLLAESAN